jgi:hypothetical protein
MKRKEGYLVREIAGETIVVPIGAEAVKFNGIMTLNSTAKVLFKALETEQTESTLVALLLEGFEVELETAVKDVRAFLTILEERGLLAK